MLFRFGSLCTKRPEADLWVRYNSVSGPSSESTKAEIIVGDYEYKHPNGNMPSTYPTWFKPNPVIYRNDRADIFGEAFAITSSEDVLYVPTPGHTSGHSSVIFKTDDYDILFAGDTSYNQEQVLNNELAGVNADYGKSKKTYKI